MNETLREGQQAFNKLYSQDAEIANMIRGTEFDPFYNDSRLNAFHARVLELQRQLGR